jgi:hypothetical protein
MKLKPPHFVSLISDYNDRLAVWRIAATKCGAIAERQGELVEVKEFKFLLDKLI